MRKNINLLILGALAMGASRKNIYGQEIRIARGDDDWRPQWLLEPEQQQDKRVQHGPVQKGRGGKTRRW